MNQSSESGPLFKQPEAWIPLAMSLAALAMVTGYAALFGTAQHAEEGAPARLFQLIMLVQLPVAAYFALKWLPRRPAQALAVLCVQALAWVIPIIAVTWLESL